MAALVVALLAACGGEPSAPTPSPMITATLTPTVAPTTTPTVVPTPSATPVRSPVATPTPTPTPMPTPTPTVTPSPATPTPSPSVTPSPTPPAIDYLPLVVGEPRELPAGLALFFGRTSCWQCGPGGYADILRVVFDAEAGAFRADRPLASFDGGQPQSLPLSSFAVSRSGREMAVAVCAVGACAWPLADSGPDAEMHFWFSRDGGGSWEEAGVALPGSFILDVTADDVLVWELNEWYDRNWWDYLDDEEWADFLAPLAPLGVTPSTSWRYRLRWLGSGEEFTTEDGSAALPYRGWKDGQPDLATPPAPGGLEWYMRDAHPDGVVAWRGWDGETSLLAVVDAEEAVQDVYGLPSGGQWSMSFVAENLILRGVDRPPVEEAFDEPPATEVELLDLATLSVHPIKGLSLPMDEGPASLGVRYGFLFARPVVEAGEPSGAATADAPTPTPPAIDYLPLTVGEPRALPAGLALFFGRAPCWRCGAPYVDILRVVFDADAGAFRADRPLASLDEVGTLWGYPGTFAVSRSGREMAVAVCHAFCAGSTVPRSPPDVRVWRSRDGGKSWEDAGAVLPPLWIEEVTVDDVLVREWNRSEYEWDRLGRRGEEWTARLASLGVTPSTSWKYRLRWLGSGEEFTGEEDPIAYRGWRGGQPDLMSPPALGGLEWRVGDSRPDGAVVWDGRHGDVWLLAVVDTEGALQGVYGLPSSGQRRMSFVAENLILRGVDRPSLEDGDFEEPPATEVELLDLATLRVHPVEGLSLPMDEGPASVGPIYHFLFARPLVE